MSKNILWLSGVFFQALNTQPRTPLGELTTLPQTLSSTLERGDTPRRLDFGTSVVTNSWLSLWPNPFYWPILSKKLAPPVLNSDN